MVPSPEKAPQMAMAFVKTAREVYHREMDFSLGSLDQVDAILDDLGQSEGGGSSFRLMLVAASCYLGEVIIRAGAGQWAAGAPGGPLVLMSGTLRAVPYDKVLKRLAEGPDEALRPYAMLYLEKAEREREEAAAQAAARPGGLIARLRKWVGS